MKRTILIVCLFSALLLAACNLSLPTSGGSGPVESTATIDAQIQTQLAEMISTLPTSTPEPQVATATEALATLSEGEATATQAPSEEGVATATPEAATATPEPQVQATATQTPLIPTATPSITPTFNPSFTPAPGDPRARLGSPGASDPMNDSSGWVWPTGKDLFTIGEFKDGYLVMTAISELDGWRLANPLGREFVNTYIEADFRTETCEGSDHYGIIFRVPLLHTPNQGYLFGLTCDGRYSLRRWDAEVGPKGEMKWLVKWTSDSSIVAGSNQSNRLGVMVIGKRIFLYVNGKLLTEAQDDSYEKGYFGVFIGSDKTENMVIKVDNMAYWENPNP